MKVLHIYKTYFPEDFTGIPRVIHAIAEGTASLGVESHVFALTKGIASAEPVPVDSHVVHQVRRDFQVASTDFAFGAFSRFRKLASEFDILHYHFPWPTGDFLHLLAAPDRPAIVTYHSDVVRQKWLSAVYAPMRDIFLSRMDRIVATSPNYAASSPVLQRFRDKVQIIPIGIGPRPCVDVDRLEHWRRTFGEEFFLFVGSDRYYKGLDFLIEAATMTQLPVVIVGEVDEGLVARLPPNAVAVGRVSDPDKEALLDLCLAFVFPSHLRSEAFGVALLEAARAGKPMISCEIGTGTSFVNVDGQTGLVVPPRDASSLISAMWALAHDRDDVARMGANAHERFEAHFTQREMARSYDRIYKGLAVIDTLRQRP